MVDTELFGGGDKWRFFQPKIFICTSSISKRNFCGGGEKANDQIEDLKGLRTLRLLLPPEPTLVESLDLLS